MLRICKKCNIEQNISHFQMVKGKYRRYVCNHCRRIYGRIFYKRNAIKICERSRLRRKTKQGKILSHTVHLKRTFGLTYDEYNNLLNRQDGKCAICKGLNFVRGRSNLSVDHNHKTNKVRGLLCYKCNAILGFANDDISILQEAINYLNKER